MEKRPVLTTSFVAISAKLSMAFAHTDFFSSHEVANASAIAILVSGLPAAFMGAIFSARCYVRTGAKVCGSE